MKVRIQNGEIRLRIDRPEIDELLEQKPIKMSAPIDFVHSIQMELICAKGDSFETSWNDHKILVQIPRANVLIWKDNSLATFTHEVRSPTGEIGLILFEVDLKRESKRQ